MTFTWTKNNALIVDQRFKVLSNGSLHISHVQESDAGKYTCVVNSIHGNGTTSGQLVVQGTYLLNTNNSDAYDSVGKDPGFSSGRIPGLRRGAHPLQPPPGSPL